MNLVAAHEQYLELEAAVVEQQDVAADYVLGQVLVIEADALLVAERTGRVENEGVADAQRDFVVLELADPDLRTLQVAEDADGPAVLGRGGTNAFGACLMVLCRTVREVHADDINAGLHQTFENFLRRRGGAERGNDLGMAGHFFSLLGFAYDFSRPAPMDGGGRDTPYFAARSSRMAMAGRVLPSRNSRKAPPPVEM